MVSLLTLLLGLWCIAAVIVLLYTMIQYVAITSEIEAGRLTIPVMARTLPAGAVVRPADVKMHTIDQSLVPVRAIRNVGLIVGRTVQERVLVGEFLREERLAPEGSSGLDAIVPVGMRAMTLNLRDGDRVSGFVEPGNLVDLVATLEDDRGVPEQTLTLAEGLRVLALDEQIVVTATGRRVTKPSVTLAMPAQEAERVAQAAFVGSLKLVLRSDVDFEQARSTVATTSSLVGLPEHRVTAREFHDRFTEDDVQRWIDIVHGSRTTREPVVDPSLYGLRTRRGGPRETSGGTK